MKKIKDFNYYVTKYGDVFNSDGLRLTPQINRDGYRVVNLWLNGKSYHKRICRLVAEVYVDNPHRYPVVDHNDMIRTNDYYKNLEWVTVLENNLRSIAKAPEKHKSRAKISQEIAIDICMLIQEGFNNHYISQRLDVTIDIIKHIRSGKTWKEISKNYEMKPSYKSEFCEDQIRWVCKKILDGFSNKEIEELSDGEIPRSLPKSLKAGKTWIPVTKELLGV